MRSSMDRQIGESGQLISVGSVTGRANISMYAISLIVGGGSRGHIDGTITRGVHTATRGVKCGPGSITHALHAGGSGTLKFIASRVTAAPCTDGMLRNTRSTTDGLKCVLLAAGAGGSTRLRGRRVSTLLQCGISNFLCTVVFRHGISVPRILRNDPAIIISDRSTTKQIPSICPSSRLTKCSTASHLVGTKYEHVICCNSTAPVITRNRHLANCQHTLTRTNVPFSSTLIIGMLRAAGTTTRTTQMFSRVGPSNVFYFGSIHTAFVCRTTHRHKIRVNTSISIVDVSGRPFVAGIVGPSLAALRLPRCRVNFRTIQRLITVLSNSGTMTSLRSSHNVTIRERHSNDGATLHYHVVRHSSVIL